MMFVDWEWPASCPLAPTIETPHPTHHDSDSAVTNNSGLPLLVIAHMATRKSPLRDRLLSNSPDPIKSSILRDSGMGWNTSSMGTASGNGGSITSPLRIAKRESPALPKGPAIARRSSSSYRHVHNNNLVTKSPFKSQIPTPSTPSSRVAPTSFPTRRVSGEKRPRPSSLHEQAETENDRPLALKRERKQSKAFQGLIEKEPVTKSPFKVQRRTSSEAKQPPPPMIPLVYDTPLHTSSTPPVTSHIQAPAPNSNGGPSPGRSNLVSRRLHGPRLSGGSRRERRKTVTFYERCDVLEFDRDEESDEAVFESAGEEDPNDSIQVEDDLFQDASQSSIEQDECMEDDASYESVQLDDINMNPSAPSLLADPDASITGIVEEMFFSSNAANLLPDASFMTNTSTTSTPPRYMDIPTDLETEDGVPFGRSHHVERFLQHHEHQQQSPHLNPPPHFSPHASPVQHSSPHQQGSPSYPFKFNLPTEASPHGPPATPPRRSPALRHSTPPLGRSTHLERVRKLREEEREDEKEVEDVERLPPSPSPMKPLRRGVMPDDEGLIPRFDLLTEHQVHGTELDVSTTSSVDPFASEQQDESFVSDISSHNASSARDASADPADLSVLNSEANSSGVESESDRDEVEESFQVSPGSHSSQHHTKEATLSPPVTDHLLPFSKRASPGSRSASPLLSSSPSRERISREDVQRRLLNQRKSTESPKPSYAITIEPADDQEDQSDCQPPQDFSDRDRDRMSVLTTQTDFSTETAIVETVQKRTLGLKSLAGPEEESNDFGMLGPGQFDFGSKFSLGGFGVPQVDTQASVDSRSRSNTVTQEPRRPASIESASGMKMGDVDVDMDMKSALDRLMEDVAGAGAPGDDSMMTDEIGDSSYEQSQSQDDHINDISIPTRPKIMERAAADAALLQMNEADGVVSRSVSGSSTMTLPPPPVPPKDNIRQREQIILEKRREARRIEEEEEDAFHSPRPAQSQQQLGVGRPSRRRSMSTGDAETLGGGARQRGDVLLDVVGEVLGEHDLGDSIERELQKLVEAPKKSKYHVRERETTIYASSSEEKISHMAGPGDVDAGRAWRTVRRPSDMNEYAKQIKEYRSQDKGKAYGKVFVKVLGVRGMMLPLPQQPTVMTCTLNNGIHFVTTPECQLAQDCKIDQEFELIEHSKLEFTLTLKVRRDPHINAQFKSMAPAPVVASAPPPIIQTASKSSGMRSFFSSSPKKSSKEKIVVQPPPQPQPVQRLAENLARHLKPDGTLARAFISFKDISSRCDTRLFETSYPLIGQRVELGGKFSTCEVGEIVLQMFRLPPLPGIPPEQLPQSLEECHRGLRHINWHKVTYFQGTLTQSGGDCRTWRRRQLRVIGSNLVAFNDVTKKATATIDLKKAIAVEDDQEARSNALSPSSGNGNRGSRYADEYDGLYGVERSFRLLFPEDQEIIFFADTDEEKAKWLEVLRALVGHIPPHPLWAELLWQRQEEFSKRMAAVQQHVPPQVPQHHQSIQSPYSRPPQHR
ncbi:hypothetical protein B0H34DRAFT_697981 [Crassisporium funariophilum]|nr:hypothetical protein B0H34DRAFT_697981 [Crassisporium funariophilum]